MHMEFSEDPDAAYSAQELLLLKSLGLGPVPPDERAYDYQAACAIAIDIADSARDAPSARSTGHSVVSALAGLAHSAISSPESVLGARSDYSASASGQESGKGKDKDKDEKRSFERKM